MRKKMSPTKSKVSAELSQRFQTQKKKRSLSRSSEYQTAFYHYNNAVYMGGMSSYKKHGKGLILHDDGSAMISEYLHDTPTGHNIIFRENSITSILYLSMSEFQIAYKQGNYIIMVSFNDGSMRANGGGVLIDYCNHRIYRLGYKKGKLYEKVLHLDKQDNDDVFNRGHPTKVLGIKHQQAFDLTFEKPKNMHINSDRNKKTIGFFGEDGQVQGLAFTFYTQNIRTNGEKPLYLKFIERGYYRNSLLQIFGEKIFKNGNRYIGQFDQGMFNGYGILISPEELKWVFGKFFQGQLNQIQESNYKQHTEEQFDTWTDNLRILHRRFRERWIDADIHLPEQIYLYKKLQDGVRMEMTHIDPDHHEVVRDEAARMSKIQEQFQREKPGTFINSKVERELDNHYYGIPVSSNPIKIQIEDQYVPVRSKVESTPVNKMKYSKYTQSIAERQYQMEDPFQIQLKKVPFTPQSQQSARVLDNSIYQETRASRLSPSKRIYELEGRKSRQSPPLYKTYSPRSPPKNTLYKGLMEQFDRHREQKQQVMFQPQIEERRFRDARKSPQQEYIYSSDQNYMQRYAGSVINKRNFNYIDEKEPTTTTQLYSKYPTTTKYSRPDKYAETISPARMGTYYSSREKDEEKLYYRRKSPSPRRGQGGHKNFIKNNYLSRQ